MEPEIELFSNRIVMKDEDNEVQIIADDVEDMEPYIKKLYEWAATTWDYSAVDDWQTVEYSLLEAGNECFKVHKLGKEDKRDLFLSKYAGNPETLKDYENRKIEAWVYIKITTEEYKRLLVENKEKLSP